MSYNRVGPESLADLKDSRKLIKYLRAYNPYTEKISFAELKHTALK